MKTNGKIEKTESGKAEAGSRSAGRFRFPAFPLSALPIP